MDNLEYYLAGLPAFVFYFAVGIAILGIVLLVFKWATPHEEIRLIRSGNVAAATAMLGVIVGLSLPIASASINSVSLLDFLAWGLIGGIVQLAAFFAASLMLGGLSKRLQEGEVAAGLYACGVSIAFGVVNAASMIP